MTERAQQILDDFTLIDQARAQAWADTLGYFGASTTWPDALKVGTDTQAAATYYENQVDMRLAVLRRAEQHP